MENVKWPPGHLDESSEVENRQDATQLTRRIHDLTVVSSFIVAWLQAARAAFTNAAATLASVHRR